MSSPMNLSYCHDPEGWGPASPSRPDLTLCFEYTILQAATSVLALVLFTFRARSLHQRRLKHPKNHATAFKTSQTSIYRLSVSCMLLAVAALLTCCIQLGLDSSSSLASKSGTAFLLVAWMGALALNHVEHRHNEARSSTYIFSFYVLTIFASALHIRTLQDLSLSGQAQFIAFCVFFAAICVGFVVEAWPRKTIAPNGTAPEDMPTAYDQANLCSRLCFHFMQKIISLGYKRPLQEEDIANVMPRQIRTINSYERVSEVWEQQSTKAKEHSKSPSLFWIVIRTCGWSFLPVTSFALLECFFEYTQPVLLDKILDFIDSFQTADSQPVALGIILALSMFACSLLGTMARGQYFMKGSNLGIEIKSGLISMIYRKALKLSPGAKKESTVGEISNHMAVDAERVATAIPYLPLVFTAPIELAVGMTLLYRKMGPSSFTGLGVVVLMIPAQSLIAKAMNRAKDKKLADMDNRVKLLTEVLSGIKIVKLYAWETSFHKKIDEYRASEMRHLRTIGVVMALTMIMFSSLPSLMTLLSFAVYANFGGPNGTPGAMTAQVVFVCVTLFNRLSIPIGRLSIIMSQCISFNVAAKRIQGFLLQEEIDDSQVEYQENFGQLSPENGNSSMSALESRESEVTLAIHVQDGTFSWLPASTLEKDDKIKQNGKKVDRGANSLVRGDDSSTGDDHRPALTDIQLKVPQGSLTMIMGRVGQGKSSLMSAVIGDMYKYKGSVRVQGSVALCTQQAWIINATLKDNIIFGKPFDQKRYDTVVKASGLAPDFKMLPAGDQTEIGERGINLSGGQRQRVSLARAAYQDADIYLLDDPLSAVDAHVDQHLWENLIGPGGLLKDKTRLLITHGIHHLAEADQIVVIRDGSISETGTYHDLMTGRNAFYQLISEYSIMEKKKAQEEENTMSPEANVQDHLKQVANVHELAKVKSVVEEEEAMDDNAQLIVKEEVAAGSVGFRVFLIYCKAATYLYSILGLLGFVFSQACQIGINMWLKHWTSQEGREDQESKATFLGVYGALVFGYFVFDMGVNTLIFIGGGVRASSVLHKQLLDRVLRLPMSFFDTTPVGRIINRFSTDIDNIDEFMPLHISDLYYFFTVVAGTLIVISISVPIFMVLIPFLMVLYFMIQAYYIRSSRSLKRIDSIAKSPLYQHFGETLSGVSTIRAMRLHDRFILENARRSDRSSNAYFAYQITLRWMHFRLEILGAVIVLATAMLAVLGRETLGTGMAGIALSYAITCTMMITSLIKAYSGLQNQLVGVERIQEMCDKNPEADSHTSVALPPNWPDQGRIVFKHYSTRYRQGMDLVIKDVSFEVNAGEKVGIVGRTGAGKSSLTLALFRIVEAANSYWAMASHNGPDMDAEPAVEDNDSVADLNQVQVENALDGGSIEIDGVDISTVGLEQLRSHLAIIPQDPTLFAGTVRDNLDPFGQVNDAELWEALERAHLKEYISSLPGGLSHEVEQNGDNFSVGQRSLICLARALLRKTKILVLDEATAAVDVETDELIQKTIRKEFKDRTILTIAHRIKTIMDSDKVLVLEKGRVEEYDTPRELVTRRGLFYSLAAQAGEVTA